MKINKKAFTLVELLVVVLIIGILAAIAVPQYQKAVAKAELAQIISLTRSIKEAEELYYLTNGKYAQNINRLDLSLNNTNIKCKFITQDYFQCYNKNFAILYYFKNSSVPNYTECFINSTDKKSALAFACKQFLKEQSSSTSGARERNCGTKFNWDPQKSACLSFAGSANF